MFNVTVSVEIKRAPGEVFAFAGDYRNDPAWRAGVVEMTLQEGGSPAVGVTTRETMRSFGRRAVTVAHITEYGEGRTAFRSISGPVSCEGMREFVMIPFGTRMTYSLTLYPKGLLRLIEPLLAVVFRKQVAGDMRRLKDILESRNSRD